MRIESFQVGIMGANCYILIDEKSKSSVMIDAGGDARRIKRFLESEGLELKAIFLTHGHMDHIEAVPEFKEAYDCKIYGHLDDEDMFKDPVLNLSDRFNGYSISFITDELVADGEIIEIDSFKIKAIHTPGHTKGGVCYLVDNKLFTGDTLFYASIGRSDLYGGDSHVLQQSIKNKLFTLPPDTVVLPGHGKPTVISFEVTNNPYVSIV